LRAVEVLPTRLPLELSKLDKRILEHVIAMTGADYCYRSIREDLPAEFQDIIPDIGGIDYSRVRQIRCPRLKQIQGYIVVHEPEPRVSLQKIADALAGCGVRRPRRRPRRQLGAI
jgi:hypothetical protein